MKYSEYLETDYWKTVARAVKTRAGYKCQVCNSPHDLNAHHRSYDHRGKELDHLNDMICLCRRCHGIFHGKAEEPKLKAPQQDPLFTSGEMVVLTREMLEACRTARHGLTSETMYWLGVKPPLIQGWFRCLRGKAIPKENYEKAVAGNTNYGSHRLKGLHRKQTKLP